MKETPETVAVNLLHEILAGRPPELEWIEEQLIRRKIPENQHLDYKGGKITSDKNSEAVRKAISGMANAEGGVIIFGVNGGDVGDGEEPWSISACSPVGKLAADEWLKACLEPLRAFLHPRPVFHPLDDGEIVLAGVSRATNLVPSPVKREGLVYFLRFYDQTLQVPPYLIADLVLGRRQRPRLQVQIGDPQVSSGERERRRQYSQRAEPWWALNFQLHIENAGMIWAESLTYGVIAYTTVKDRDALPLTAPIEEAVYYYPFEGREVRYKRGPKMVDLPPLDRTRSHPFSFSTHGLKEIERKRSDAVQRWSTAEMRASGGYLPGEPYRGDGHTRCTWLGALFVTCRGYPPSWFQLEIEYNENERIVRAEALEIATDRPWTGWRILVAKPGFVDEWIGASELDDLQYPTRSRS